jgi:uncharacterized membrane protein YcaP (DUF421 family)
MNWHRIWTPQWSPVEVVFRAAIVYFAVFILLRLVGRKELGRYSSFDVALLALMTTAARQSIVGTDTSITSAVVALTVIFVVDRLFSHVVFKSSRAADVLEGEVLLLVRDGVAQDGALRHARLSREELIARLREHGTESMESVSRAYFERSGRVTVVSRPQPRDASPA